jgi:hypothetical protein
MLRLNICWHFFWLFHYEKYIHIFFFARFCVAFFAASSFPKFWSFTWELIVWFGNYLFNYSLFYFHLFDKLVVVSISLSVLTILVFLLCLAEVFLNFLLWSWFCLHLYCQCILLLFFPHSLKKMRSLVLMLSSTSMFTWARQTKWLTKLGKSQC